MSSPNVSQGSPLQLVQSHRPQQQQRDGSEQSALQALKDLGGFHCTYPALRPLCGDEDQYRMLSLVAHFDDYARKHHDPEGWYYLKVSKIEEITGLKKNRQGRARKRLIAKGLIEEKLRGNDPPRLYFRACWPAITEQLGISSDCPVVGQSNSKKPPRLSHGGEMDCPTVGKSYKESRDTELENKTPTPGARPSALFRTQPPAPNPVPNPNSSLVAEKKKENSAKERKAPDLREVLESLKNKPAVVLDSRQRARLAVTFYFEMFCELMRKDSYTLTPWRERMFIERWLETEAHHSDVGAIVERAIWAVANDTFYRRQSGVDWESIFKTTEAFERAQSKADAQDEAEAAEEERERRRRYL